jgi:hypothetical protein
VEDGNCMLTWIRTVLDYTNKKMYWSRSFSQLKLFGSCFGWSHFTFSLYSLYFENYLWWVVLEFRPCHGPSSVLDGITSRHHTTPLGFRRHKAYGLKLDYGVATHCLMKSPGVSQPPSCKRLLKPF